MNPLSNTYDDKQDDVLITDSLNGSKEALSTLISNHQNYIYNLAFKMVLSPYDAEDITQEVLIKIITNLGKFNHKSSFRTWVYRITLNHFLSMKKKWLEERYQSFSAYEQDLDSIPMVDLSIEEQYEMQALVEEARLGCLAGMLLCLSREQRMVYILGEIFAVPHDVGAELLDISKDNYRQRLTRARKDLHHFMHKKCGLVNPENPCRCHKKTKGFIEAGWVDPSTMKFNTSYTKRFHEIVSEKDEKLKQIEGLQYRDLQQQHPFQEKEFIQKILKEIFTCDNVKQIFELE